MDFRTDLALEIRETLKESSTDGIESEEYTENQIKITKIKLTTQRASETIGKPMGTYITAEIPNLTQYSCTDENVLSVLGDSLRSLLPNAGTVLITGLGNLNITPDALGPLSCEKVLATRHISDEIAKSVGLDNLRPCAVQSPGVLGQTGVETAEIINGLVRQIKPSAVIVIDALAARKLSRLGSTVQMADVGIVPGSGVGNSRCEISQKTLGVPVISMGVPTVVDAKTLVYDLSEVKPSLKSNCSDMIITPREIDLVIQRAAKLVGMTVNRALQPQISIDEMLMLVG